MPANFLLAPIALAPAVVLLIVLDRLDSFRLVSPRAVLTTLALGGLLAVLGYFLNAVVMDALALDIRTYTRVGAPVVEEVLKAAAMVYFFQRARIGFLIDAAIIGFAIGTGFALVENLYFLYAFPDANLGVWIVRGFGTAIMHGGAAAIFGVLAERLTERHTNYVFYLPGLAAAIALHALFNQLLGTPMIATAVVMPLVPLVLFFIFAKSEHRIHDWLLHDYETHEHLLAESDGEIAKSEAGRFIAQLADKFEDHTADIYAYMRLHAALVVRAEKLLLAREGGAKLAVTSEDHRDFDRLHELERKIGRTAMMALWPHLHYSREELAELYELETRAKNRH